MSTKDIIKGNIYENLAGGSGLSSMEILIILLLACLVGTYIFMVYRLMSKAAFYSKDTGLTIAGAPVVIAAIMVAMQSSLIVSLGMVGALSIVRFRNAVKNPLDLLYLFWTISAGIICGVGLKILAILLCLVMTFLLFLLSMIPNLKNSAVLILCTNQEDIPWEEIDSTIKANSKSCKRKSKSIRNEETEVIYELFTSNEKMLLNELKKYNLQKINYLDYDGEYRI